MSVNRLTRTVKNFNSGTLFDQIISKQNSFVIWISGCPMYLVDISRFQG